MYVTTFHIVDGADVRSRKNPVKPVITNSAVFGVTSDKTTKSFRRNLEISNSKNSEQTETKLRMNDKKENSEEPENVEGEDELKHVNLFSKYQNRSLNFGDGTFFFQNSKTKTSTLRRL